MSYSQLPTEPPTSAPPAYGEPEPRTPGDNIPDDFKYDVNVALCELPIRQLFIRKVYALLTLQIFATVTVGFIIRLSPSIRNWCLDNIWVFIVSLVGSFAFLIATHFKARSYPINLVLLGGFTLCEAFGVGIACSFQDSAVLLQAVSLTAIIFIGLTAFAFQTKYDFTSWQGVLGMSLWALIGWGFLLMFFPFSNGAEMVYSGIGALIFSGYILVDTQMILKTACLDDEVVATLKLYLDILNLFMHILNILSRRED